MENHPIPQDVTGFQFKLIGNMTVKQFAYLATGSVLAVILYYAPVFILLKVILIPLFGGLGAALAFLPIEGRPMDLMLTNFIHDLINPTQYLYHRTGGQLAISTVDLHPVAHAQQKHHDKKQEEQNKQREAQLNQFLTHVAKASKSKIDEKEDLFLTALFDPSARPHLLSAHESNAPVAHTLSEEEAMRVKIAQSPEDIEHELEREAEAIKQELASAVTEEKQLQTAHQETMQAHTHVTTLEKQLQDILLQKQQLEQELQKLKQTTKVQVAPAPAPIQADMPMQASQNIRVVPTDKAPSIGLPSVPDVPNIILGIIRDPRGNVLPNILVEIKDKDGNPVRAFKTNGLGHFASSTPLANGTYTLEFEDPKGNQQFEVVSIDVNGEILLPLEIISHDAREQLRKELFN